MKPFLIVSSDFVKTGGMDYANHALASWLARQGREVHLVAHSVDADLLALDGIHFHRVPRPMRSNLIGERLLDKAGRYWADKLSSRSACVVVNGGNCMWSDVNWVHYVHAAYRAEAGGHWARRVKWRLCHSMFLARESKALGKARLIIASSNGSRENLIARLRLPGEKIRTVYMATDPQRLWPASPAERAGIRQELGWSNDELVIAFVGALGDRRKGFDLLMDAWGKLSRDHWDVRLIVAGAGAELPHWKKLVRAQSWKTPVDFLGFRRDVPNLLRASDALVSPTRYEAYGLGVHEALACGIPAFVSSSAGIAERIKGHGMDDLLLPDPEDTGDLAARLKAWRSRVGHYAQAVRPLSDELRRYTWDDMSAEMVQALEAN